VGVLVSGMKGFVVGGFGLPHSPDNLEPSMPETTDGLSVAFALFTQLLIIYLRPLAPSSAQISPEVDRAA